MRHDGADLILGLCGLAFYFVQALAVLSKQLSRPRNCELGRWPDCAAGVRSHVELSSREFLRLTVPPSRNGDHYTKKKDEEWDHRRLDAEW